MIADFEEAGDDDVFRKVRKDFDAKGVAQSDQQIRTTHERADGAGGRADQSRQIAAMANLPGYSLARRLARRRDRLYRLVRAAAPIVAESIAREGFNTVTIDQQHGLWDTAATAVAIAVDPRRPAPRRSCAFRSAHFAVASRALDFGAEGIIAPMINTVADAKAFVGAAKFPPLGERSWGPTRAMMLAGIADPKTIFERGQRGTVTLAMIETRTAMANLDAIAAVPGIDVLFVGPSDLSIALSNGKRARSALRYRRQRRSSRSSPPAARPARSRASIAPTPSARWPAPSAASASSRSAAISASCAPARRRSSRC